MDSSGTLTAVNTFGANGLISRRTTATGQTTFYTFDERGNVAQRLSSTGAVLSTDLYDAYGNRASTTPGAQPDPWGYGAQAGYYTDSETGLILCTHRYYDPAAGRFVTRDPIGYDGGVNLYSYTANNPINRSDPSGFTPKEDVAPGQVTNPANSGVTVTLVFDLGNRYEYKLALDPGFTTDPKTVDIDWIQTNNGWAHLYPNYKVVPMLGQVPDPLALGGYTIQPDGSYSPHVQKETCDANHLSNLYHRSINWPQGFGETSGTLMKPLTTQQALNMGLIHPTPPTLQNRMDDFSRELGQFLQHGF